MDAAQIDIESLYTVLRPRTQLLWCCTWLRLVRHIWL